MAKGKTPAGAGAGDPGRRVFVVGAGGDWCIEGFGPGDVIAVDCPGVADFAALRTCLSEDGQGGTRMRLPGGQVIRVAGLDGHSLGAGRVRFGPGPAGFLRGTLIGTAAGARRVETLRPGDLILTRDHGAQPLLHVSRTELHFGPGAQAMKPLRLAPHALAPGVPEREMRVPPGLRLGLPAAAPQVVLAARKLRYLAGVSGRPNCRVARCYHLLLERHELVRANGAWAETLLLTGTTEALAGIPAALQGKARQMVRPLAVSAAEAAGDVEA